jgi:hypothetical protein
MDLIMLQATSVNKRVYRLLVRGQGRFGAWAVPTGYLRARELTEISWTSRKRRAVPDKCAQNMRISKEGAVHVDYARGCAAVGFELPQLFMAVIGVG